MHFYNSGRAPLTLSRHKQKCLIGLCLESLLSISTAGKASLERKRHQSLLITWWIHLSRQIKVFCTYRREQTWLSTFKLTYLETFDSNYLTFHLFHVSLCHIFERGHFFYFLYFNVCIVLYFLFLVISTVGKHTIKPWFIVYILFFQHLSW